MKKAELIHALAESTGQPQAAAARFLDAFIETVTKQLKTGENLTVKGFGSFKSSARPARTGRNPSTGEPLVIAAAQVVRFSPGTALKAALNPEVK